MHKNNPKKLIGLRIRSDMTQKLKINSRL